MSWSCGIVGLPNAGKSTFFKALTAIDVPIDSYPFTTIDPNVAVVPLKDPRLEALAALCGSTKVTPPAIRIVDVAGLVEGASRGEGLGNRFLGELRNVDLLLHVVAGFSQLEGAPRIPGCPDQLEPPPIWRRWRAAKRRSAQQGSRENHRGQVFSIAWSSSCCGSACPPFSGGRK